MWGRPMAPQTTMALATHRQSIPSMTDAVAERGELHRTIWSIANEQRGAMCAVPGSSLGVAEARGRPPSNG